jgi:hypothetical protein
MQMILHILIILKIMELNIAEKELWQVLLNAAIRDLKKCNIPLLNEL